MNSNSDEALRDVWKTCYEFKEWAVEIQENKRLLQVIDELKEELFFYKECYERGIVNNE